MSARGIQRATGDLLGSVAIGLAVAAAGCGGWPGDLSAYEQDTLETRELRAYAASVWAAVGVEPPPDESYGLGLLPHDELQVVCQVPEGPDDHPRGISGCTFPGARVILLDADQPLEVLRVAAAHEIGHLFRGERGHLQCDRNGFGPDLMCPRGSVWTPATPSARDVAFVARAKGGE